MGCNFPEHHGGGGPDLLPVAVGVLAVAGAAALLVLLADWAAAVLVVAGVLAVAGTAAVVVLHRAGRGLVWRPAVEPPDVLVSRALEARLLAELAAAAPPRRGRVPLPDGVRRELTARLAAGGELAIVDGKDGSPAAEPWVSSRVPASIEGVVVRNGTDPNRAAFAAMLATLEPRRSRFAVMMSALSRRVGGE